ncbi:DUF3159 domain-containing protein [Nocardioides sp. GXQ0305]|uniref:DUF3159 domain-containing protein n=1 Tax=Nocardioides sp. GXQ0305 TaxID=3423912 RepID=UPI003D7C4E63
MSEQQEQRDPAPHADAETVEQVVRGQLAKALGGRRGMIEAAVPTVVFTVLWISTRQIETALVVSVSAALVLLVVRLVQRSTVQFVLNALFGIGLGWLFVTLSARGGASEDEQALAYFLPGILYNSGYAVLLAFTCLIGWPLVGFMVGSVTGDPTAWHHDKQVVRLCSRLTWLLVLPCVVRVAAQAPVWLAGRSGAMEADTAVAVLGVLKIALGWPLQVAALAAMVWLLARNHTPVASSSSVSEATEVRGERD